MKFSTIIFVAIIALFILNLSCNSPVTNIDWSKIDQKAMIKAMEEAITKSAEILKPSVHYIEINRSGTERYDKSIPLNGIVFKSEGYLVIPSYFEKKDIDRIKVWIDETEYPATIVDADKDDEITIIKVQTDKTLIPAVIGDSNKITTGEYLVGVQALDKESYYEKSIRVFMAEGKIEGKNDRILTSAGGSDYGRRSESGIFVANLNGEIIGTFSRGAIVAFNEKKKTADRLVARSLGKSIDIEEQQPWKGFSYTELTEEYAQAWGFPVTAVLVNMVYDDAPAGKAGLKREDVIIAIDDQPITKKTKRALSQLDKLLNPEINQTVKLKIMRDKSPIDINAKETLEVSFKWDKKPKPKEFTAEDIGLQVCEITDMEYLDMRLFTRKGVVVKDVIEGSSAATSSSFGERLIYERDVIIEFYGMPINNLADFVKAADKVRTEKPISVLIKLQRGNKLSHSCLNLEIGKRTKDTHK